MLRYNLPFKWFLDLIVKDEPFHPTSFTKNREWLETIEAELCEARRSLDRIWRVIEKTVLLIDDSASRIMEHMGGKEQLEAAAEQRRNALSQRRLLLVKAGFIAKFAVDLTNFLRALATLPSRRPSSKSPSNGAPSNLLAH